MEGKTLKEFLDFYSEAYSTLAKRRISSNVKTITQLGEELKKLEVQEAEGKEVETSITSTSKRIRTLKFSLIKDKELLKRMEFGSKEMVIDLQNKILKHPRVEDIRIDAEDKECTLNVFTSSLKYHGPKDGYEGNVIGKFRICLSFSKTEGTKSLMYTMYNLTKMCQHLDQWAVNSGQPCFGDWAEVLSKYAKSGEVFLLVDTLIHFIETAGDDHAYNRVPDWFHQARDLTKAQTDERKKKLHTEIYGSRNGTRTGDEPSVSADVLAAVDAWTDHAEMSRAVGASLGVDTGPGWSNTTATTIATEHLEAMREALRNAPQEIAPSIDDDEDDYF